MDKETEEIRTSMLDELNEIANDLGWNVEMKGKSYRVISKRSSVVFASENPYEVAFYMGGSLEYNPGLSV